MAASAHRGLIGGTGGPHPARRIASADENLRPGDRGAARARVPRVRGRADGRLRALRDGPGVPDRAGERGDRRAARAAGGGEHGRGRVPSGALAGRALPRLRRAQLQPQLNGNSRCPSSAISCGWTCRPARSCRSRSGPAGRGRTSRSAARRSGPSSPGGSRPSTTRRRSVGGGGDARALRAPRHEQSARGRDWSPGRPHAGSDPADPARGGDPAAADRAHHQRRVQRHVLLAALRPLPDARATRSPDRARC